MIDDDLLNAYRDWTHLGEITALHILSCEQCVQADIDLSLGVPAVYCPVGQRLWDEQIKMEDQVVAMMQERGMEMGQAMSELVRSRPK